MIAILGAGGHGHDIADTLTTTLALYDDHLPIGGLICGDLDDFNGGEFIIGVNDPRTRRNIADRLARRGFHSDGTWVHPSASVGPDVTIGNHTHINAGVTVTRTTIGGFCTISPGANICGDVTIGNCVTIGAGAVICQFAVIGDGATIGAGATVTPHSIVPTGEVWVGTPAGVAR